jgi:DNA repair exonuclease SbcCD ATPase subunit
VQAGVVEEGTEARIEGEETRASRAHKMLALLRKHLDDQRSLTTVMWGYENNLKEAQKDIATFEARMEEQDGVLKGARGASRAHLGTMQDLKAKLASEEAELVLLEQAKKALSVKGIRAYVIDAILPVVNSKLKHYARRLTSGEMDIEMTSTTTGSSGKVTNKLDTKIHKEGRSVSYSSLSAGERKRVDICALLALLDVLIVNGKASGLLVLDELFDALDSAGIEAAVALIHELPHDNIFVVSHNSELKSLFNYVITVEKEENGSRIVL